MFRPNLLSPLGSHWIILLEDLSHCFTCSLYNQKVPQFSPHCECTEGHNKKQKLIYLKVLSSLPKAEPLPSPLYGSSHYMGIPMEVDSPAGAPTILAISLLSSLCVRTQSCLTLRPHGLYTVHGILQARILEWVSFPFCRGSSQLRD